MRAHVEERLVKLRLGAIAERLDGILSEAARGEPTYLDFLDQILGQETDATQKKRVAMGIQIAHFPSVKSLEKVDFKFQPSVNGKLVRELATGRFVANAETVLLFGPPGVLKTHLAIALGRAVVESGHSVLFVTATALLAQLSRAASEGKLAELDRVPPQGEVAGRRRTWAPAAREADRAVLSARQSQVRARHHAPRTRR